MIAQDNFFERFFLGVPLARHIMEVRVGLFATSLFVLC